MNVPSLFGVNAGAAVEEQNSTVVPEPKSPSSPTTNSPSLLIVKKPK